MTKLLHRWFVFFVLRNKIKSHYFLHTMYVHNTTSKASEENVFAL